MSENRLKISFSKERDQFGPKFQVQLVVPHPPFLDVIVEHVPWSGDTLTRHRHSAVFAACALFRDAFFN